MSDRLVRKGLVRRYRPASNRREVRLTLTAAGRDLVRNVTVRRRDELSRIVEATKSLWTPATVEALAAFATQAGEPPEHEWWLGWQQPDDTDPT
jgi:DNA-binding MarR family transcriptional regulator